VFATAEGDRIQGYAYFAGGARAGGASISVQTGDGRVLATPKPDAKGSFSYVATGRRNYVIVASTGDGHVAKWTLAADELPATLPTPSPAPSETPVRDPSAGTAPATDEMEAPATISAIEQAVAHQMRPLREELRAYQDQIRWRDTLGGIGYIFGLAGLALWWHSRRDRG